MNGVILALISSVWFAATAVLARIGVRYILPLPGTLISLTISMLVTLVIAMIIHPQDMLQPGMSALVLAMITALLSYPIGRLLSFTGMKIIGVAKSSTIVGSAPLFATATAVLVTGESVTLPILVGGVTIVTGMMLIVNQQ